MNLPEFRYHPDPIATGSIKQSDVECACCRQRRGLIYVGPVYSVEELSDCICPWCIADGSAHDRFDAEFTDAAGVGGYGGAALPDDVTREVAYRTPGFIGWQQEKWGACCGDAAAFLGRAGRSELESQWPDAIASIKDDSRIKDSDWDWYFSNLHKDGSPTAYVFRCLHCGKHVGYSDCD
jgi:uncharacterized protein CbrC (UPF0167 family)